MVAWIFSIVAAAFGLLGLFLAARGEDVGIQTFGFGLIGFAIVYIFTTLRDQFNQAEQRH